LPTSGATREGLPACEHLASWTERNTKYGDQVRDALEQYGVVAELAESNRVAAWAYGQTEAARRANLVARRGMVPLATALRELLRS
jgi:hypothetical protein